MQISGGIKAPKDAYNYLKPSIESIKELKKKPNSYHSLEVLIRTYQTENDIAKTIKFSTPLFYPYDVKDSKEKLVKDNIESLEMLVLDIDSGCTVDSFISMNQEFDYYLYTTVTHRVTGIDKFRVVIPLEQPMPIDEALARKQALLERFSHNGKTYLDESFLAKGRGFVIPVEMQSFREYELSSEKFFDLQELPKVDFIPAARSQLAIQGFEAQDGIAEIKDLADLYINSSEDDQIEVDDTEHSRNDAFFWIHVEIAKYRPTEEYQKQLAIQMNWDNCRNTIDKTVEAARKHCSSINLSALNAISNQYWDQIKTNSVEYIKASDIEIHEGKKHLLTATTGTGKTSFFLGNKCNHKVIFAVPINSIGQQAKSEYGYPFLTGTKASVPNENKIICSYNYLVELMRIGIPQDYVIVLDEFHRVLSDDFRAGKLSELVDLVAASNSTVFCMSGTFDPSLFPIFEFDHHYDFKASRATRPIHVLETSGTLDNTLIRFLNNLSPDSNNLVLFDDKRLLKAIQSELPDIKIVTSEEKQFVDDLVNPENLGGRVSGTILTTQVLMEGINLYGLDNIVVVAKKHYGKEQIVQFFERDRDLSAKCHLIRKPIKGGEDHIPDSDKEKEYQNQIYNEVISRIGLDGMKLIGVRDTEKLFRVNKSEIFINSLYAPMKQKQAMDRVNFKNLDLTQYGYELLETKSIDGKPVSGLQEIKRLKRESEKEEYSMAIDLILSGREAPNFPVLENFIGELKERKIPQIRKICADKKEIQAYSERFSYIDSNLEQAIYEKFKVGQFYLKEDCISFLSDYVGQKSFARVCRNNHLMVFRRYFHLTNCRKSSKREAGVELDRVRNVGYSEGIVDLPCHAK